MRINVQAVLTASENSRIIRGCLVPFGEVGHPGGPYDTLIVDPHSLIAPVDPTLVPLTDEHDEAAPLGHAIELSETETGVDAAFLIDPTPAGDEALALVRASEKRSLSIEISGPVVKDGHLVAGVITGASHVARPGFTSAQITAKNREKEPEMDPEELTRLISEQIAAGFKEHAPTPPEPGEDGDDSAIQAALDAAPKGKGGKKLDARRLFETLAGAADGTFHQITAALSDIVPSNTLALVQPEYVGELWSGKAYERRVIPAFNRKTLTAMKVKGWQWVKKPAVGEWAGNKTAIPSDTISTKSVEITPDRIAGGHDIDRIYRDFNEAEFWAAYFAAMTESYAQLSDTAALGKIKDAATKVTLGSVPTGVSPAMVALVDGALNILSETNTVPDHAFFGMGAYRDLILTRKDDVLAYLSATLGLEDGSMGSFKFIPRADLEAGEVLVTAKPAVTVHELGGDAPIRVEALDISKGGIDAAVYGYQAVNIHDATGLALVNTEAGE